VRVVLAFLLCAGGTPEVAVCQRTGDTVVCASSGPTTPLFQPQPLKEWYRATPPEPRKVVGTLLAKGDCDGAVKAALEAGDIDLANAARAFCSKK
jgi:hypothetical protein